MLISCVLHGCGANDATIRCLGRDNVCNVSDALVIQVEVTKVWLADIECDSKQFQNCLVRLSGGERAHSRIDKVELLLEVVKADGGVYAVPVQSSCLIAIGRDQSAVNILLIQDVEEGLVQL